VQVVFVGSTSVLWNLNNQLLSRPGSRKTLRENFSSAYSEQEECVEMMYAVNGITFRKSSFDAASCTLLDDVTCKLQLQLQTFLKIAGQEKKREGVTSGEIWNLKGAL